MSREMTDEIEFAVACVNEFAQKYGMTNADALRYLDSLYRHRVRVGALPAA